MGDADRRIFSTRKDAQERSRKSMSYKETPEEAEKRKHFVYPTKAPTTSLVGVMKAIESKNYDDVLRQIDVQGKSPNEPIEASGSMPLELCAWKGDVELGNLLIERGADPSICTIEKYFEWQMPGARMGDCLWDPAPEAQAEHHKAVRELEERVLREMKEGLGDWESGYFPEKVVSGEWPTSVLVGDDPETKRKKKQALDEQNKFKAEAKARHAALQNGTGADV